MDKGPSDTLPAKARKKRIPKACGACRHSKVKCDSQRPCSRLNKTCAFEEPPKDEQQCKIESLEREIESLRTQLRTRPGAGLPQQQSSPVFVSPPSNHSQPMDILGGGRDTSPMSIRHPSSSLTPSNVLSTRPPVPYSHSQLSQKTATSPATGFPSVSTSTKRKKSHFQVNPIDTSDFVAMGLVSMEEAESYFNTFFRGCYQYIPVFDTRYDSLQGIRSRNDVLFNTICATGCRILKGSDSHSWHLLNFHLKRVLNAVIGTNGKMPSLEIVQALLVRACYVSERSLLVTLATRLAIDLGLPDAYDELSMRYISRPSETRLETEEHDVTLMRKTRTWLHLLVLGHILHVDASDLLIFKFRGDVRRCRVLLETPFVTDLDLHLISQVELNVLRANTYTTLANCANLSDGEVMDVVRDAKVDIDVWFHDWIRIFEKYPSQEQWLAQNLRIQKCWADTMAMCRAVRVSGVENVDAMSAVQRDILLMAKDALRQHLGIIIEEPRDYLSNLRFAMDFVWAKCAFCFLLLLKLSVLLADDDEQAKRILIEQGQTLLAELHAAGGNADGGRSSTSRVYLQLLQTGIEKYSRTVLNENISLVGGIVTGMSTPRQRGGGMVNTSGHNELESFVPEQFLFEWDFPGLTLFSSPTTEAGWLDDFLNSALIGDEEFYGLGWNIPDVSE